LKKENDMRKSRNRSRKLTVESLENRALLAGNVSVFVDGTVLKIIGDGRGNGVSVQELDQNRYFVTGFAVSGGNTTINGQLAGRIVQGVRHIDADLNSGYDVFVMSNSAFRRNQLAQQLSGNTAGPIQASPEAANPNTTDPVTTRVSGNVSVKMDQGNDGVGIVARIGTLNSNGDIVEGVLSINGGDGRDQAITDRTTAFDDMLFDMGSGNDSVHADVARVGDFVFANLGDGDDSFVSNNAHGWHSHILGGNGNDSIQVSNYRFEREVLLDGGSGNDFVNARGLEALSIAIITGDGEDGVNVDSSTSHSGLTIDTGSSHDWVILQNSFVNGPLGIFMGDQDDNLRIGNTTAGDTTLSGGSGFDRYHSDGGNNVKTLNKSGFEQNA
jgi:hypothetical protein